MSPARPIGFAEASADLAAAIIDETQFKLGRQPAPTTGSGHRELVAAAEEICLLRRVRQRRQRRGAVATLCEELIARGLTLHYGWPRSWSAAISRWIGPRLFLTHARNLTTPTVRYASLVSSRWGRHGGHIPGWPRLINAALRCLSRERRCLLIAPGTTTAEVVTEFGGQCPQLDAVYLDTPDAGETPGAWLARVLQRGVEDPASFRQCIRVSPELAAAAAAVADCPLADRLQIGLADFLFVLHVSGRGNMRKLIGQRLAEPDFPLGRVFFAICGGHQPPARADRWMARGGIGWLLPESDPPVDLTVRCSARSAEPAGPGLHQLVSPLPSNWRQAGKWRYLCHCTRGTAGPMPEESLTNYRLRLWHVERLPQAHPLSTLDRICREGRLKGTAQWNRAGIACVSFSAVPLPELLDRRCYRSHLGRWDWEPFGLLIDRAALSELGARPVLYGGKQDYLELKRGDRPFFQPARWSDECEWRLAGDLILARLPPGSLALFVERSSQAFQMARQVRWPVFFCKADSVTADSGSGGPRGDD